ncbi:hypothetical protein THICB2_50029 [Thiomonas sp. CB2]|nr:hypothetical protein THICB2_50029 [Thiomonas sp. CB2]
MDMAGSAVSQQESANLLHRSTRRNKNSIFCPY